MRAGWRKLKDTVSFNYKNIKNYVNVCVRKSARREWGGTDTLESGGLKH